MVLAQSREEAIDGEEADACMKKRVRSFSALWNMGWDLKAVQRYHERNEPGTFVSLLFMKMLYTNHMSRRGSLLQCILCGTRLLTTQNLSTFATKILKNCVQPRNRYL